MRSRTAPADAGAGLHGHHRLNAHRHVHHHAIALLDAQAFQAVGELADAAVQLGIGDAGDVAVVGFKDDGDLVGVGGQVAVQAVVGRVQHPILEPFEERRLAVVQHAGERLLPGDQFARQIPPERQVVIVGLFAQGVVGLHAADRRLAAELVRRGEAAGFLEDGI
jgi:hypothetical protein